jgi:hydrogenase maturation protease
MRSKVLIGLGNSLSGDDGVGCHVVERLANDSRVSGCADTLNAGTDLLRHVDQMIGRDQVVLVDALLDDAEPGTVSVFDDEIPQVVHHREHAHHLSVCEVVRLLRTVSPSLASTRFKYVLISVRAAHNARALSPEMAQELPRILDRVRHELCQGQG